MDVLRVAHNGIKIESISAYELDILLNRNWTADAGTPTRYFVDLDPNNKKIRLYPIPASGDAGTNNLIIEYLKIPPALASDSDVPLDSHTLLTPYHDALAYFAASSLLNILPDQAALVMIQQYDRKYRELADACIDHFRSMGDQRPMNIYRGRNPVNIGQ